MKRLAILGASGHGKVVAEMALSTGWEAVEFFDDAFPAKASADDFLIKGGYNSLIGAADAYDGFHVAIGDNRTRLTILNKLLKIDLPCPKIIAPTAVVSSTAQLGSGISIMPNVVVNSKTVLGNGVILNTSCSVDHDCKLAAGAHIAPGAHLAGNISIGICSLVGIGSSIVQGKVVGNYAVIGAGSAVISNIPDNVTVVGVPSKIIK